MTELLAEQKPLVYSCSGCSSTAQMANYIAVALDRSGSAEMSCITGVGGNVRELVHTAQSGRIIIAIDGCPLDCCKKCLVDQGISSDLHFELTGFGVIKRNHEDFDMDEANRLLKKVEDIISEKNTGIDLRNLTTPGTRPGKDLGLKTALLSEASPGIVIKEVLNKKQFRAFIDFPYRLYGENNYYIPPVKKDTRNTLNERINPALEFCEAKYWLAYKGEKVVGRIAGIINHPYIEKWGKKYMRFGWIDFNNDERIARSLLNQLENWAKEKGLVAVHGPLGFTNFDHAGMLIEGFDQLGTAATIYNYPYYPLLMEKAGYTKDADWLEYKIKVPETEPERLEKIAALVQKRLNLNVIRMKSRKEILHYSEDILNLLNSTYSELYGMVPFTENQIQFYFSKYLSFFRPGFVPLVTDKKGALVAFGITMPSLSHALQKGNGNLFPFGFFHIWRALRKNKLADLCLIAVRKDYQGKGVNGLLMHEITQKFIVKKIEYAESNPELEDNKKVRATWGYYQVNQHKRRRCYIKYL